MLEPIIIYTKDGAIILVTPPNNNLMFYIVFIFTDVALLSFTHIHPENP